MTSILQTKQTATSSTTWKENSAPFFQAKLSVNQPNDVYEQEADAVAEKVMRMPDTSIQKQTFFKSAVSTLQRKCRECEEDKKLQKKESSSQVTEAKSETSSYINSLSSKGSPLPESTRSFFEPRLGFDFSNVKIHNDADAVKSSQSVNALAYTAGNNIVFGSNQYQPDTNEGKKLLAHELTHVVQQNSKTQTIQRQPADDSSLDLEDWSKSSALDSEARGDVVPGYERPKDNYTKNDYDIINRQFTKRNHENNKIIEDFNKDFINAWTDLVIDLAVEDSGLSFTTEAILSIINNLFSLPIRPPVLSFFINTIGSGIITAISSASQSAELSVRSDYLKQMKRSLISEMLKEKELELNNITDHIQIYSTWLESLREKSEQLNLYSLLADFRIPPLLPRVTEDEIRFSIAREIINYEASSPTKKFVDKYWEEGKYVDEITDSSDDLADDVMLISVVYGDEENLNITFKPHGALWGALENHKIGELKGVTLVINFWAGQIPEDPVLHSVFDPEYGDAPQVTLMHTKDNNTTIEHGNFLGFFRLHSYCHYDELPLTFNEHEYAQEIISKGGQPPQRSYDALLKHYLQFSVCGADKLLQTFILSHPL